MDFTATSTPPFSARHLGIDIGFGHVKHCTAPIQRLPDGTLTAPVVSFPSVVVLESGFVHSDSPLSVSRGRVIELGALRYLVGEHAALADDGAGGRPLIARYAMTTEYEVLVKAALANLAYPAELECLVLGVPVNSPLAVIEHLKSRFVGELRINGRSVRVDNVRIVDQPVAAFIWQIQSRGKRSEIEGRTALTIDVGYRTVDWVVTQGLRGVPSRSGSSPGGVSRLVQKISLELARVTGRDCSSLRMRERVEEALCRSEPSIVVDDQLVDFAQFQPLRKHLMASALAPIWESIGSATDIRDVLLVGGGCAQFKALIEEQMEGKYVSVAQEPQFLIARGLQWLAEAAR